MQTQFSRDPPTTRSKRAHKAYKSNFLENLYAILNVSSSTYIMILNCYFKRLTPLSRLSIGPKMEPVSPLLIQGDSSRSSFLATINTITLNLSLDK